MNDVASLLCADELKALLECGTTRVKLIDASFVLPGSAEVPADNFAQKRIGDAVFFDLKRACDQGCDLPHMLPTAEGFAAYIGSLGISNDDHVIIYGQSGMVMGPARVWWMLRIFGHDRVSLLDGGLPAWVTADYDLNLEAPCPVVPATYNAVFHPEMVVNMADVEHALDDESIQILDARPAARFCGSSPEPRADMRAGHMPGALNIPAGSLVDTKGCLKSKAELEDFFKTHNIEHGMPIYASCGSGVTACMLNFALHLCGFENVSVYDGSWSEWGRADLGMRVEVG